MTIEKPDPAADGTDTDAQSAKRRPEGFVEGAVEFGAWMVGFVVALFSS